MPHRCTGCDRIFADGSKEMLSGCPDCRGNQFQFLPAHTIENGDPLPTAESPPDPEGNSVVRTAARATRTVRRWVESDPSDQRSSSPSNEQVSLNAYSSNEADSGDSVSNETPSSSSSEESSTGNTPSETGSIPSETPTQSDNTAGSSQTDRNTSQTDLSSSTEWPETARADDFDWPSTVSERSAADRQRSGTSTESAPGERSEKEDSTHTSAPSSPSAEAGEELVDGDPIDGEDRAQAEARRGVVTPDELPPAPAREPDRERDRPDLEQLREELSDQFESIRIVDRGQYELNLMELFEREEYIIQLQENGRYVIDVPERIRSDAE